MPDEKPAFEIECARFQRATEFSLKASVSSVGITGSERIILASYVFTRMCVTAMTVSQLLERGIKKEGSNTLDHYSIAVLCRNLIEASIMLHYLTEPNISDSQWELRRLILDLHDCIIKTRLWKGMGPESKDEYQGWRTRANELKNTLRQKSEFKRLQPERREKILQGSELYVSGIRAVLAQLDFPVEYFDAIYNYLSGQVHVSSNSFYFTHENRIDFHEPAPYQLYVASFAIAHARYFLVPAAIRMTTVVPQKFESSEIEDMEALAQKQFGDLDL